MKTLLSLMLGIVVAHAPLLAASVTDQDILIAEIEAVVDQVVVERDEAGNVVVLKTINDHVQERGVPAAKPGLSDELALRIPTFHALHTLHIESQPLTDPAYAIVRELPALRHVQFHYVSKYPDRKPSADFCLPLAACRNLESLAIHHNFHLGHVNLDALAVGFPDLRMLSLDTGAAGSHAVPLIVNSPKLRLLALNRCSMNDADIAAIVAAHPQLEYLKLRVAGRGVTAASVPAIAALDHLRYLGLGQVSPEADQVDQLAAMSALEMIRFEYPHDRMGDVLAALRTAAPHIDIAAHGEDAYWHRGSLMREIARGHDIAAPPP